MRKAPKKNADAIEIYEKYIKSNSNDLLLRFKLAKLLERNEQRDRAIEILEGIIEIDPKYPNVYATLGQLWLVKGNVEEALKIFAKGIEDSPKDYNTYLQLGVVQFRLGEKAKQTFPDPRRAQQYKIFLFSEAEKNYTKAIEHNSESLAAIRYRADIRWLLEMFEGAIQDHTLILSKSLTNSFGTYITTYTRGYIRYFQLKEKLTNLESEDISELRGALKDIVKAFSFHYESSREWNQVLCHVVSAKMVLEELNKIRCLQLGPQFKSLVITMKELTPLIESGLECTNEDLKKLKPLITQLERFTLDTIQKHFDDARCPMSRLDTVSHRILFG